MKFALRTICSTDVGFGHLRRSLTLADELKATGHAPTFWLAGDARGFEAVAAAGHTAEPADAALATADRSSIVIVDDYAIDGPWLSALRPRVAALALIDDLCNRPTDVDLVLNSAVDADELPYHDDARLLLGPRYALLRRSFRKLPPRQTTPDVRRVLVTLGGADPGALTPAVVATVRRVLPDVAVDVVIGPLFAEGAALDALAGDAKVTLHRAPGDLAPLMKAADLAVSGGGQTSYELAAVGLPSLALVLAENQRRSLQALAAVPTLVATDEAGLGDALAQLATDRGRRQSLTDAGQRLVDGQGVSRVAEELLALPRRR
ncbi:MAG TPA: UDP-2,4-diacetamido-2,4,6-trideoxy-beta-L-altropyranose hydrolase [Polyangia bacterium]|nr:UDP-2,4-diacetamido-2,4,6-trideoxy-beta-L-altropyranose hydrolase [Polyangia bacterium]